MVYADDLPGRSDIIVYRASSFGFCDRALTAARLGYPPSPPPASLQATFDAGHAAEDWYMALNPQLHSAQTPVQLHHGNVCVRGHLDAVKNLPEPLRVIVEVKSQSPAEYACWTPDLFTSDELWKKYAWQLSVYMWAAGNPRGGNAELELVRIRRPEPDEPDEDYQVSYYHLERPFHSVACIRARIDHLNVLAGTEQLPPCSVSAGFGCPYYQLHEGPELVDDVVLDLACERLKDLQAEQKALEALVKGAKRRVVELLDGRTEVATVGGFNVKYTTFEKKGYEVKPHTETRLTVTGGDS